jgi:defect in organelle trafficking protein DotC
MKPLMALTLVAAVLATQQAWAGEGTNGAETWLPASPIQASQTQMPTSPTAPTLDALANPPGALQTSVTDLRAQMLNDAGMTVGFRGGMAARAQELTQALDKRASQLDTLVQFAPLVSKQGTLPPVIVQAKDVAAFAKDQVRMAHQVYKMEREERFVSVPPTWRDYLLVGLHIQGAVELPLQSARPTGSSEHTIWRTAVQSGWADGVQQANAVLAANFNRLARDYSGMVLYSTLLQQGMVVRTRVAESRQVLSGNHQEMILGDTLRRVTDKARLETDTRLWRAAIRKPKAVLAP